MDLSIGEIGRRIPHVSMPLFAAQARLPRSSFVPTPDNFFIGFSALESFLAGADNRHFYWFSILLAEGPGGIVKI